MKLYQSIALVLLVLCLIPRISLALNDTRTFCTDTDEFKSEYNIARISDVSTGPSCLSNINLFISGCDTIVNYDILAECPGYTLNLLSGLPSGSSFPIGITTVTYELTNATDTLTCNFDVKVYNEWELYGLIGNNLVSFNTNTGDATLIAPLSMGYSAISGLTYHRELDEMFAVANPITEPRLISIDRTNGTVTEIGDIDQQFPPFLNLRLLESMSYNPDDSLMYAAGYQLNPTFGNWFISHKWMTIDPATGDATYITNITGTCEDEYDALSFGPSGKYGLDGCGSYGTGFYNVDVTTGAAALIGINPPGSFNRIAVHPKTGIVYALSTGNSTMLSISTTNASLTTIGTTHAPFEFGGNSLQRFTFVPSFTTALKMDSIVTDIDCSNQANAMGSVDITISNGIPPYSYIWSNGSTSEDLVGLVQPGTYFVTISDDCSHVLTGAFYVDDISENPIISLSSDVSVLCVGETANLTAISDIGTTISWYNSADLSNSIGTGSSLVVSPAAATTYHAIATSADGCVSESVTVTIDVLVNPNLTISSDVTTVCPNGTVNLTAVSDVGATITWYDDMSLNNIVNTGPSLAVTPDAATIYYVVATLGNGCNTVEEVDVISELSVLSIENVEVIGNFCESVCNNQATVHATLGDPPYSYQWDTSTGSQTTQIATGLCTGTYTVTVTDMNGCMTTATASIIVSEPLGLVLSATDVSCFGESNGIITVDSISGGVIPYTFSLNDTLAFTSDTQFVMISGGLHTVYIKDGNDCIESAQILVNEPTELVLDVYPQDTLINLGDSVELSVIANQANITFNWTPANSLSCDGCPNPIATNTTTTLYTVVATDTVSNCEVSENLLVTVNLVNNLPDVYHELAFKAYPNPFTEAITFELDAVIEEDVILFVYDVNGREVARRNYNAPIFQFNRGQLSSGVYFYTISSDGIGLAKGKMILY